MLLTPHSRAELARQLAEHSASGLLVSGVDLRHIRAVVEHQPEDMTATVEAGLTLGEFQEGLRRAGQWLPIDPPNASALTISDLLAFNWSGPRRFGFGTIRDYLIGIKVALADGEIIKAGGKVVKNVAGYDLCKLFVGAQHSLGAIVEASFKLRPIPECEMILESPFETIPSLQRTAAELIDSAVDPIILDAHNHDGKPTMVVGFAGASEDVAYQLEILRRFARWSESSGYHDQRFPNILTVLPSRVAECLEKLDGRRFVARLGNGVIYHEGPVLEPRGLPNPMLAARVKQAYDPRGIFPPYSL